MDQELRRYIEAYRAESQPVDFALRQVEHWLAEFTQFIEDEYITSWDEVTTSVVKRWQSQLIRAGHDRSAVSHHLAALYHFFEYLVREGKLDGNPMEHTNLPSRPRLIFESLSPEDVARLLSAPDTGAARPRVVGIDVLRRTTGQRSDRSQRG